MSASPVSPGRTTARPRPRERDHPVKHLRDFAWLLRGELFLLREEWFWYLVQATFVPVSQLLFLWFLVGRGSPQRMGFFLTGSLVLSLSFGGMLSLGQHLGLLKAYNAFEYYATLPIAKAVFIAAVTTRGMLLSLPSAGLVLGLGRALFGLTVPPLGLLVLALAAYAMSGFGAVVGFWSPTAQVASLATQVLQTIIVFFAPIFYPLSALPWPLRLTARLWPTTYAAEALRGAVAGAPVAALWRPLLVLAAFAALSLVLIPRKLDWRGH